MKDTSAFDVIPRRDWDKYDILKGCKFCHILHIKKSLLLYEDELCGAFHDKRKSSAVEHVLICPKKHIRDAHHVNRDHIELIEHLEEKGKYVLEMLRPKKEYRFGYHEPPMNSVDHLHLHCFVLPIATKYLNDVVYGYKLCSTKKLIAKIHEKFPIPTKPTDIVDKIDPELEI
mmetsp:Transcript_36448/g.32715  ORF Transcript_36448/g.32715 Transcript_36448/m.32715 type:complete len:173 (-) Transcript_36448:127-645(-)